MKKLIAIMLSLAISMSAGISAFAADTQNLDNGSVKGLPEGIYIMDSDGNKASEDGSYYVDIQDMKPNVVYTKTISLQNLIDTPYTLTMSASAVSKGGNLDLENNTNVKLFLDNELVYDGKVTGEGKTNMTVASPLNLGELSSGQSKELRAEFLWDGGGLDKITGNEYKGEVDFKWTFEAALKQVSYSPSPLPSDSPTPNTGVGSTIMIIFISFLAIDALFIFLMRRRNKTIKEAASDEK